VEYHLDMELTRLCQDNAVSAIGLIHRLDLLSDIISSSTVATKSDAMQTSNVNSIV